MSYDAIANEVFEEQCSSLYEAAQKSFAVANYGTVIEKMEKPLFPKGELTITRRSAEPVPGPFTGIEY